jgi:uncharacterized protein YqjF (DUF2071 family)
MFPFMKQKWSHISFFHWRCEPSRIRFLLPFDLTVDIHDSSAWVSLTPFLLEGLRPAMAPDFLGMTFPETNLRTYVRGPEGPGLWFFSLDAAAWSAVLGARAGYALPYFRSQMNVQVDGNDILYTSRRTTGENVRIHVQKADSIPQPSPLDVFLTARFRLYSQRGSRIYHAEVQHEPWPLYSLNILDFHEELRHAAFLGNTGELVLSHYSPGVEATVSLPSRLRHRELLKRAS